MVKVIKLALFCFSVYCTASILTIQEPQLQRLSKRGEGLNVDLNLPPPEDPLTQGVKASSTGIHLKDSQSVETVAINNTDKKRKRVKMVSVIALMI